MQISNLSLLPDRPIARGEDDLLGRRDFALNMAEAVNNAPAGSTLRIGIYGGWGEGKTSVLAMMRGFLQERGHVCIWLNPWITESKDAVSSQITREIARALGIDLKKLKHAESSTRALKKVRTFADVDIRVKAADTVIGPALESILGKYGEGAARTLIAEVQERLGQRKLIVFVDDLDRVRPDLVPTLLLTLREALDHPDYYYVLALAPEVVERGLASIHAGWGEPRQFLEKIVELPRFLPKPSQQSVQRYVRDLLTIAGPKIDPAAVLDVASYLPSNPRRIKLFIRYLASISSLVDRFDTNEFDRRAFYIAQLLKTEFPQEVESLIGDIEAIKDIELSFFRNVGRSLSDVSPENDENAVRPEYDHIAADHPDRPRFILLCNALRERGMLAWGRYGLAGLLAIPELIPAITMKEANDIADRWLTALNDVSKVQDFTLALDRIGRRDPDKVHAIWATFIEMRSNHVDAVVDKELEDELVEGLETAGQLLELLREFWAGRFGYRAGFLGADEWKTLRSHIISWAHFTHGEVQERIRRDEWSFLEYSFSQLSPADQGRLYTTLRVVTTRDPAPGAGFVAVSKGLRSQARNSLVQEFLASFTSPGGVALLWGEQDLSGKKALLSESKPIFWTKNI
ncbi:KAP family P-loop NTPase fold protein [Longimicrobium sp.]|jgi:hypothetical protein|uniref:KAP family P-loop NTPase fold protein n=1 Tax=Longimicrobium sp. TaxID=2029185 RepID=UPI002ED863B0